MNNTAPRNPMIIIAGMTGEGNSGNIGGMQEEKSAVATGSAGEMVTSSGI